jgi:hypothetical protein
VDSGILSSFAGSRLVVSLGRCKHWYLEIVTVAAKSPSRSRGKRASSLFDLAAIVSWKQSLAISFEDSGIWIGWVATLSFTSTYNHEPPFEAFETAVLLEIASIPTGIDGTIFYLWIFGHKLQFRKVLGQFCGNRQGGRTHYQCRCGGRLGH